MLKGDIIWPQSRRYKTQTPWEPVGFFSECLCNASRFDLMLGFFSSSAISVLADGFAIFLHNGGRMRLIINDILTDADKEAIKKGNDDSLLEGVFDLSDIGSLCDTLSERDCHFFECLSWLIRKNKIEIKVLEQLNHENIIQLKEVVREYNGEVSYIFEYCDCNLLEFIEKHRKYQKIIPEPVIRDIILQITKGINYMHLNQFFHRDLKPENILVILNNYDFNRFNNNGQLKIKIADFGTAKEIPLRSNHPITDYVCTRWYRAPECVLRTDFYNEKVDIWAIGCIMAELYKLGPIFPGEDEFDQIHQILKILGTPTRGKWPWGYSQTDLLGIQFPVYYKKDLKKILQYISKEGVSLLNEIFQFESSMRPSCSKILSHPYFKIKERSPVVHSNLISLNRRNMYLNQKTENDKSKNYHLKNRISKNKIDNNNIFINDFDEKVNNDKNNNGTKIIRRNKNCYDAENINSYQNNINTKSDIENNSKAKNIINNNKQKTNRSLYISNYSSSKNIKNNYYSNDNNKLSNKGNTIRSIINNDSSNYIYRNINNNINYINNYNNRINNLRKIDTDKKIRNDKYKAINKIKLGITNKKILRLSKNLKEESKNNESDYNKKNINPNKIGRIYMNEDNFNTYSSKYKGQYSYIPKGREENKEDSKNKSIENEHNRRFLHFSSDKCERPKKVIQNRNIKELKIYNEIENDYNNLSSDGNGCYNKYNSYKNVDKKNILFEDSLEKKIENNIIFRRNNKNINRNNHRFYESNACRINYQNNDNYYSYNGYNKCKCSFLRNNSARRNILSNKDEGYYAANTHKTKRLGDYYMNNNSTPRAHSIIKKENNNALSPIRRNEQNNFLYSSFIISKKNHKMLFGKSQNLSKNNTIRNINPKNNFKKSNDNLVP